jgi:hypothetical protein
MCKRSLNAGCDYSWTMRFDQLRKRLALRGLTPVSWVPEASAGRAEEATLRPARVVEGERLAWMAVPADSVIGGPWPEVVAFLDGVQRSELVAYAGAAPIVGAEIGVAVRERRNRKLVTAVVERRALAIGRPSALDGAGDAIAGLDRLPLPDDDPPHPVRDLVNAARALDRARGALEVRVGSRYRAASDAWLVVDGSLAESPVWAADPRMVGVVKSHATLPFDGADLEHYLRLPSGHRSSVFAPETRSLAPVHAWALRLWPWEGKDLFHGLVRVEVAPANGTAERAAAISRWLLTERAPVSTPDPRWDRLLYGIYAVEQYLKTGLRL